uniref:Putative chitinase n=1 Tax=Flammulina velutipes TaxID=38945 RepID=G8A524_FLAVE|nr:putative chitinase [Flammulina velutipes]
MSSSSLSSISPISPVGYGAESVFAYPPGPSASSSASDDQSPGKKPLVMAYYPDWISSDFPPEKIAFDHYDWIDFAFAIPTASCNLTWDDPQTAPALLSRLVDVGHAANTKIKLSIGGWTGSHYFSDAVATNDSRQLFAENIALVYKTFGIDGIDIDWEYPGHQGESANVVSHQDALNFLAFLRVLRAALPAGAIITAATQPVPFVGEDGQPMRDVSEFATLLDWILIMNYDVYSSSSTPGPNAPFYDACHNSTQPEANAVGAFNAWNAAGVPASQMVLGIPSYGYLSTSTATTLRSRFIARQTSSALVADDNKPEGQIQFRSLVSQNALVLNSTSAVVSFVAGEGFVREWDECSSTPYLRSSQPGQVVSYDDTESLALKAAFVQKVGPWDSAFPF